MKKLLLSIVLFSIFTLNTFSQCTSTDIIISAYMEGSSNNKCVVLYNGTSSSIDLTGYNLNVFFNGSSSGTPKALSGTIGPNEEYLVCDDNTTVVTPDLTIGAGLWNGDDAITLTNSGGDVLDSFGQIGTDPGSQWGGACGGRDQTITKDISSGTCPADVNATDSFDTDDFQGTGGSCLDQDESPLQLGQPVKLKSFKASNNDKSVLLSWSTASEKNNDYFIIEKSENGKEFYSIGEVSGNGTSDKFNEYSFTDRNPSIMNYYRLKQVDYDGSNDYSHIVNIRQEIGDKVQLTSNNISNTIKIENGFNTILRYSIVNTNGAEALNGQIESGYNTIDATDLNNGMYFISFYAGDQVFTEKIYKF